MPVYTRKLLIVTTWKVYQLLESLVVTGMYGTSVEAAAEELLREKLREMLPPPLPPAPTTGGAASKPRR